MIKPGQFAFLAVEVPLAAIVSIYLLRRFCARYGAVPFAVAIIVGMVWFMSLLFPFLLPLDVAEMTIARCKFLDKDAKCGSLKADPDFLLTAWHLSYWFCFSMSWLILPIVSSYLLAGAFSIRKRILFALRSRLIFFLVVGVLFGLATLLLILRFQFSLLGLSGILVSLANGFGVIVATLMLSYGLIEVPKWLWRFGDYDAKLRSSEIRATYTMERMEEAKLALARVLGSINTVMNLYENSKHEMPSRKRKTIKKYIKLIQIEVPDRSSGITLPKSQTNDGEHCALTEDFLAGLRYKVKKRVIEFRKVHYLWRKRCIEAFELQDLVQWRRGEFEAENFALSVHLTTKVYIIPFFSRLGALFTSILTMAIIWSEATLWTIKLPQSLDLSPFSYLLHNFTAPYVIVQIACFLSVSYLYFCLFFGIFRFRLFMLYELVPRHTDPFTLVLNSMLCSRLLIPLAYNFITIMHETKYSISILYDSVEKSSAIPITKIAMLHRGMSEVPVFGVAFNLYFPAVIVLFVILTLCKVWDKIMNLADLTKYSFEGVGDETLESYGRNLLAQERVKWMEERDTEDAPNLNAYTHTADVEEASQAEWGEAPENPPANGESAGEEADVDEVHQYYKGPDDDREPTDMESFGQDLSAGDSVDIAETDSQPTKSSSNKKKTKKKSNKKSSKATGSDDEYQF